MMHSKPEMTTSKMKGEDSHENVREVAGILMHFIPRATPETHLTSSGTRRLGHPRRKLNHRRDRSVCSGGNLPPVIAAMSYSLDMPGTGFGKEYMSGTGTRAKEAVYASPLGSVMTFRVAVERQPWLYHWGQCSYWGHWKLRGIFMRDSE
jgi:hypothetical protein